MDLVSLTIGVRKSQLTARFFGYLCLASLALSVVTLFSDFMEYKELAAQSTVMDTQGTGPVSDDGRQSSLANFQLTLSVATMVMMLTWFHSAYKLLVTMGTKGLRFSPTWAAGAFFVPLLNFWRPFVIARELWHGNNKEAKLPSPLNESPVLVNAWWACWLVTNILAIVLLKVSMDLGQSRQDKAVITLFLMVNEVLGGLSMFLTFLMVNRISAAQALRAEESFRKLQNQDAGTQA